VGGGHARNLGMELRRCRGVADASQGECAPAIYRPEQIVHLRIPRRWRVDAKAGRRAWANRQAASRLSAPFLTGVDEGPHTRRLEKRT